VVRVTKFSHRIPFDTDDSVLSGARLLSRTITAIYDKNLRPLGITASQIELLDAIDHSQPATRAELARIRHREKSTLTRNLRAILSAGWAEEVRENADGRSRPISLTAQGRELLLNAQPLWSAARFEAEAWLGQDATVAIVNTNQRVNGFAHPSVPNDEYEEDVGLPDATDRRVTDAD
jgi:DNA-binding MarR family transcriptional regulator